MPALRHTVAGLALTALLLALVSCTHRAAVGEVQHLRLPPGFSIAIYAQVPGARTLAVLPSSRTVIVGTRGDKVYAVRDTDGDGRGEEVRALYSGLNEPNGVAYHAGHLYVAERHRIRRAPFAPSQVANPPRLRTIRDGLPDDPHHGTRVLAFGPDGKLYVALGSPCNVCKPQPPADAILRMNPDGSGMEVFARGIRNSVGLDFHPGSGELYFTDNGADWMGDDLPPDELNHAPKAGLHFGFPWYGGGRARTEDFSGEEPPASVRFPVVALQAHGAALGLHFYRGTAFPAAYRHDAFVAQHGSWNRSVPVGYRILRVRFDAAGRPTGREVFAEGWLRGRAVSGRPVAIAELDDGSLLVSDDAAGLIYRIRYGGT